MEFEPLTLLNENEWNDFCLKSDEAWFRHTTFWQEYILDCRSDSNSKNLSFLAKQNGKIVAVVPLISQYIYSDMEKDEFANYDTPIPLPAIKNDNIDITRENVINEIQKHISEIAKERQIKRGSFFIDPLIKVNPYNSYDDFNLLKYDFIPSLKTTTIIDLSIGSDIILRQMRKGHKADIKAVFRDGGFKVKIFDKDSISNYSYAESMGIMQNIHFIDSGRKTRSDKSWIDSYEWIQKGCAILILVWSDELKKYVSGAWFMTYKGNAYYGSYATIDSSLLKNKIGYVVQWTAIQYFIEHNFQKYETGWNYYSSNFSNNQIDSKILEISKFKRGFGGKEYPLISFSKNYD